MFFKEIAMLSLKHHLLLKKPISLVIFSLFICDLNTYNRFMHQPFGNKKACTFFKRSNYIFKIMFEWQ